MRKKKSYTKVDINYQKSISIKSVAESIGIDFKKGDRCFCPCPSCSDSTSQNRGAHINPNKNEIHCFVCGENYNPFTLVGQVIYGLSQDECFLNAENIQRIGTYIGNTLGFGGIEEVNDAMNTAQVVKQQLKAMPHTINPVTKKKEYVWEKLGFKKNPFAPYVVEILVTCKTNVYYDEIFGKVIRDEFPQYEKKRITPDEKAVTMLLCSKTIDAIDNCYDLIKVYAIAKADFDAGRIMQERFEKKYGILPEDVSEIMNYYHKDLELYRNFGVQMSALYDYLAEEEPEVPDCILFQMLNQYVNVNNQETLDFLNEEIIKNRLTQDRKMQKVLERNDRIMEKLQRKNSHFKSEPEPEMEESLELELE